MRPRRDALCALLLLAALVLPGCGGDGALDRARDRLEERIAEAQADFEERRKRYGDRIREVLDELERVFPRAQTTNPTVRSNGANGPQTIDVFMTRVLDNIDRYWTRTFAAADLYRGVLRGLPGESAGYGRAAGDFAVAYVLAHEYAHNLQQELGMFDTGVGRSARPYELQADCLAGTWAHSVFEEGLLQPGDLEEATNAALAVGDFDVGNAQHHGTPDERRDALLTGYDTGEPAQCNRFVEAS